VRRITGELAGIADQAMLDAAAVLRNARRALRAARGPQKGRLRQAINHLDTMMRRTQRVVAQTRSRLAGVMPESATRLVGLHDADARPIRKGRLGKPVEFGYKAQIVDNADGVILDHSVEIGNPADAPQLAPAIERIARRAGRWMAAPVAGPRLAQDGGHDVVRVLGGFRPFGSTSGQRRSRVGGRYGSRRLWKVSWAGLSAASDRPALAAIARVLARDLANQHAAVPASGAAWAARRSAVHAAKAATGW